MEEVFKNPVQFSKGIDLKELITSQSEFHLDMDFKREGGDVDPMEFGDMMADLEADEDSDGEDMFKTLEDKTEKKLLSSPDYLSFQDLGATMVNCDPIGLVKIKVLEEGDGPLVPADSEVLIQYAAYWEHTSIPFDSSVTTESGGPWRVRLNTNKYLPGIEIAIRNVRGPKARFLALLQPAVMWGDMGALPRIRREPALFVILLDYVGQRAMIDTFKAMPEAVQRKYETTIHVVTSIRNTAKALFQRKKYYKAARQYQHAISCLLISQPETPEEESEIKDLKVKIYVNLAVCYHKLEKPKYVLFMCKNIDKLIDIETHCKALFYCGKANEFLGRSDIALGYYKKALKLEPNNKEIGNLLADLDAKIKKSAKHECDMWQRVFKSESAKAKIDYEIDNEFQAVVQDMCKDLAGRSQHARFDLSVGTSTNELECIKNVVKQFQGLVVEENGEGRRKTVSIVKRN